MYSISMWFFILMILLILFMISIYNTGSCLSCEGFSCQCRNENLKCSVNKHLQRKCQWI